jgi:predicted ATP-dependent endonuclease of OLD family
MHIQSFEVLGLNGRETRIYADLARDLNILTGRNGAGKTNLLKLLWYIMSGNILIALQEVPFQRATLKTDIYECTVFRLGAYTCRVEMVLPNGEKRIFEDIEDHDDGPSWDAEEQANNVIEDMGSSVFFPTFRRIEGGFTLNSPVTIQTRVPSPSSTRKSSVEEGLIALSRKLTNQAHVFVAAISTVDIVQLLIRQYTDLSEASNRQHTQTSQQIIETIKEFKSDAKDVTQINKANEVLDEIRTLVEKMDIQRSKIMTPIEEMRTVVEGLFKHTGIEFDKRLSFGDAASAVNSTALSAGEKQMLSFVCYNAFYRDSVIFIDEPELSLHVDWQRQLFPVLQKQQSSNQFVIATHSPFIYSKYPEKEISIDADRGDEERG